MPKSQSINHPGPTIFDSDEQDRLFRVVISRFLSGLLIFQEDRVVFSKPALLANILDIDERKRAQELQQEADRLRPTLLDSLPHPAMLIRRDRIIQINLNIG